jgi:hypothetical protein
MGRGFAVVLAIPPWRVRQFVMICSSAQVGTEGLLSGQPRPCRAEVMMSRASASVPGGRSMAADAPWIRWGGKGKVGGYPGSGVADG